jgi:hypothetical protein
MTVTIKVEGLNEVQKHLNADIPRGIRSGIQAAIVYLKGKVAIYPPESEANAPGRTDARGRPMGYYKRGTGYINAAGVQTSYSQTLGRSWTTEMKSDGYSGKVGTAVSYAPYVHDRDHQAWFHVLRGWKTVQTVAEEEIGYVKDLIKQAIMAVLHGH